MLSAYRFLTWRILFPICIIYCFLVFTQDKAILPPHEMVVFIVITYNKTCLKQPLKRRPKICFQDRHSLKAGKMYCRMRAQHSAVLLTCIKIIPHGFGTFVLSILSDRLRQVSLYILGDFENASLRLNALLLKH